MSFQSMNGVNAARRGGLAGTTRQTPATFAYSQAPAQPQPGFQAPQAQMVPQQPQAPGGAPAAYGSSYNIGSGMMGTGRQRISNANPQMSDQVTASQNGTMAGHQVPSAVGPQQMPTFDPNDPNNAALAGYMNGGNG